MRIFKLAGWLASLVSCTLVCQVAMAQSNAQVGSERRAPSMASKTRVGARLEVLDVDKVSGIAMGGAGFAEYPVDEMLSVGGSVAYWAGENDEPHVADYRVSDLVVGAHVRAIFAQVVSGVAPYATGGLDLHRLTVRLDENEADLSPLDEENERYDTRLGANLGGGALLAVQEGLDATVGLQFRQVFGDEEMRFNQLVFAGGLAYAL